MNENIDVKINEIINKIDVYCGCKLMFFSNLKIIDLYNLLKNKFDNNIIIGNNILNNIYNLKLQKYKKILNNNFKENNIFLNYKLDIDFIDGKILFILETPFINFVSFINKLKEYYNLISEYGYTNYFCENVIRIMFSNEKKIYINLNDIRQLNVLDFIVNFNEDEIYKDFPGAKELFYTKSISSIIDELFFKNYNINILNNVIKTEDNIYGINFNTISDNYIEIKYFSGDNYEKKYDVILKHIKKIIIFLYYLLSNYFSNNNKVKEFINNKFNEFKIINIPGDSEYIQKFIKKYKNFYLTVDLKEDVELIKLFWDKFKFILFKLILLNEKFNIKINYDRDKHVLQLFDSKQPLENLYLYDFNNKIEIIKCKIVNSYLKYVSLYENNCISSYVYNSNIISDNYFEKCNIKDSVVLENNFFKKCYIDNNNILFNGVIDKNTIIKNGILGDKFEVL